MTCAARASVDDVRLRSLNFESHKAHKTVLSPSIDHGRLRRPDDDNESRPTVHATPELYNVGGGERVGRGVSPPQHDASARAQPAYPPADALDGRPPNLSRLLAEAYPTIAWCSPLVALGLHDHRPIYFRE